MNNLTSIASGARAAWRAFGDSLRGEAGAVPSAQADTGAHEAGNQPLRSAAWRPAPRSANADMLRPLPQQRGQCRNLVRTHPVAAGAINTYLDRVIGTGLALVASPDRRLLGWSEAQATDWRRQVQAEFALWAESTECDLTRAGNFYDRQRAVAQARAESGDCFTLLPDDRGSRMQPYALRLQLLEADRVGDPGGPAQSAIAAASGGVHAGVRSDANGRPEAYHVYHRHPGGPGWAAAGAQRWAGQWVDAVGASGRRRILHHWQPARPEQARGVPWFAPIISLLKDLDTYTDSELKAAAVNAFFSVIITTPNGRPGDVLGKPQGERQVQQFGPGMALGLLPEEGIESFDPNRPNLAFGVFVEQVMVQVGMALSIPVELLLKRFNSSYSASRAALLDAWMFFRTQRTWLARSFCQPVYETWLAEAVALGRVRAPGFFTDPLLRMAYSRAAWPGDSQGSINPKDEVAAYAAAIEQGLMTHERAEWELFGTDWNDTTEQKAAERRRLKADDLLPPPKPGAAVAAPGQAPATAPGEEKP